MSVISHDKKFVFISNARTGSTSMMEMLDHATTNDRRHYMGLSALPYEYHMGIEQTLKEHPEAESYFKFCFVRNPWSRFLSSFREFSNHWHHPWNADVVKFNNFTDFCINFPNLEIRHDIHFLPITKQISINNKITMDYLAKFENYTKETYYLFKLLNLQEPNLAHFRATKGLPYKDVYNDVCKKIISDFYQEDIENFKYIF